MAQGIKVNLSKETLSEMLKTKTKIEIAAELGVSLTTVSRYMKKFGLSANPAVAKARNSEKHTTYSYDKNYFKKIDTMDKAYLLGFICADGFVTDRNEIGIGVAKKDKEIVEFFQSQLKSTKPILFKTTVDNFESAELRIQGVDIANDIKEFNILPRKSLTLNLKSVIEKANLTEEQISVFLLGYFDGDGCISSSISQKTQKRYWQMNVTGTKETIEYYKEYFDGHGTITKRYDNDVNNYTLSMSNNFSTIYNALSKIYKHKNSLSFYFERKYSLFEELKNKVLS